MTYTDSKATHGMIATGKAPTGLPFLTMGAGFAWIAVLVYASSNSIVTLLVDIGRANPVAAGRNAITYCNLLFLGSLISVIPMIAIFHRDWTRKNLRRLSRRDWGILTVSAFLSSAVTPGLFFYALEHTTVTNVVLIGRIEPPLFLARCMALSQRGFEPLGHVGGIDCAHRRGVDDRDARQ